MKYVIPKYEMTFSTKVKQIGLKLCHASESKQCSQQYRFDTEGYKRALGHDLPARLADLLDIASSVYLADRLALRRHRAWFDSERRHWKRELRLIVPVRDLSFWRTSATMEQLTAVLDYATEDTWNFIFESLPLHLNNEPSQIDIAFQVPQDTCVALFSGGLDSFAGSFSHFQKYRPARAYLISAVTNPCMQGTQKELAETLKQELKLDLIHIPIRLHLKEPSRSDHLEEKTQRSRGFLYTVLGSVFAYLAGRNKLILFENGVGAINLPMTDFQIGTDNTRATNPLALLEISKLLSLVFEKSFEIENLAQWTTKAELCRSLLNSPLQNSIRNTVSCDGSFSRRKRQRQQCGVCTSCLLRRESLAAAGLLNCDSADRYQFDVYRASTVTDKNRLFHLQAMRNQVESIEKCLWTSGPWSKLSSKYPIFEEMKLRLGDLSKSKMEVIQKQLLRLYSTYLREWSIFESQIN